MKNPIIAYFISFVGLLMHTAAAQELTEEERRAAVDAIVERLYNEGVPPREPDFEVSARTAKPNLFEEMKLLTQWEEAESACWELLSAQTDLQPHSYEEDPPLAGC